MPPPANAVPIQEWQVLDVLTGLVDKSLVVYEQDEAGPGRYRLLETVRQYARDRLIESGEGEAVRGRHQGFFLALAEEADPQLTGPEQSAWLSRLETEHDNLRAALEWQGDEAVLRLAAALGQFWGMRGHFGEGRAWLADALASADGRAQKTVRARALLRAGVLAYHQGDYPEARALYQESLTIHRELGDSRGIATLLGNLGVLAHEQGDYGAARALHQESLALRTERKDKHGIALSLGNLALAACEQGDYASARALYEQVLSIQRELGDRHGVALSLDNLGIVAFHEGDHGAAQELHRESLMLHTELGDQAGIAHALANLALAASAQGDYAQAVQLHHESLAIQRALGDKQGIAASLANLGNAAHARGDNDTADACLRECLALCRALGDRRITAYALEGFAGLAQRQRLPERAGRLYGAAQALRQTIGAPLPPGEREEHDRSLMELESLLGRDSFAAAFASGQAMSFEQAAEYALADRRQADRAPKP